MTEDLKNIIRLIWGALLNASARQIILGAFGALLIVATIAAIAPFPFDSPTVPHLPTRTPAPAVTPHWWDGCPGVPDCPAWPIQPTYTPAPTPTCLPTPACLPSPLPYPTGTPYPPQPTFGPSLVDLLLEI